MINVLVSHEILTFIFNYTGANLEEKRPSTAFLLFSKRYNNVLKCRIFLFVYTTYNGSTSELTLCFSTSFVVCFQSIDINYCMQ